MRETFVDVCGARVHVLRGGQGEPLLYLHGSDDAGRWLPIHVALAKHFDVIAPDHLGFGESDRPDWLEAMDDLVLHYADLLDALDLSSVSVLGVSFGGWVAAEMAVFSPQRVRKMVVVDALGLHVDGASVPDPFMLTYADYTRLVVDDASLVERMLAEPDDESNLRRRLKGQATLALLAWQPLLHDPKLARRLGRISAPTLVVWGAQDRLVPVAHGHAYADAIPQARLEVIPDCGHLPHIERPDELVNHVRTFLGSVVAR
jgi:pimeloyl-ACP methyl ester carboxylesterase